MTAKTPEAAALRNGWVLQCFEFIEGNETQVAGAITLCRLPHNANHPFAVHWFNAYDGGLHAGDYCVDLEEAKKKYRERINSTHPTEPSPELIDPPAGSKAQSLVGHQAAMLRRKFGE
jgi:hypothetical protein